MAKIEVAPFKITLRNILEIFCGAAYGSLSDTTVDREIIGDACDYLYGNRSNTVITKIRKYVDQKEVVYPGTVAAYTRVFEQYFIDWENFDDESIKQDERSRKEFVENKKAKLTALRSCIHNAWKGKIQSSIQDFSARIEDFLLDNSLNALENKNIEDIRAFINEYKNAEKKEDQVEVITVLTILAITRTHWEDIPAAAIVPENYKSREQLSDMLESEMRYQQALELYLEGNYHEAVDNLADLDKMNVAGIKKTPEEAVDESTHKRLNRFNSKVTMLRSKAIRSIIRYDCETANEREEWEEDLQGALEDAIYFHSTEAMLIVAREHYEVQPYAVFEVDKNKCMELCNTILTDYPDADECGEAAWMLYMLEEDEVLADAYLKKAYEYSYDKAVKEYKERHAVSLTSIISSSSDSSCGYYSVNDENIYSEFIRQSAPQEWKLIDYPIKQLTFCGSSEKVWKEIGIHTKRQRFFLISNDFEKNLQELLHLLQAIKNNYVTTDTESRDSFEVPFEFFIRGQEEKIGPFIDTALARIENLIIPVHILDDSKRAARVLAQHPLFYSIRHLSENEAALLKFVVIGNTDVCEWMVREASWMLTFKNPELKTEIIIIAPNADDVKKHIRYKCPDIDSTKLSINPENCGYETPDCLLTIEKSLDSGYCYFAIDIGSDIENMAMATKIRECCIRKKVKDNADDVGELPVITFHCQNPDIANLSQGTIVINENWGNKWFNNYAAIPFGRIDHQYHWDSLTNHILEQLSLNIHLQYYLQDGPATEYSTKKDREDYHSALKDYYGRTYNRDSSMAVAMSLPYRLYQGIIESHKRSQGIVESHKRRILPPDPINILDSDTFYSKEVRALYAGWIKEIGWEHKPFSKKIEQKRVDSYGEAEKYIFIQLDSSSEVYQMAKWEQDRWNRYMISRGWTTATIKQMQFYHDGGNQSQQLYIGRMHPCIEDFGKLQDINEKYLGLSGKDKGLHMSNITSIQRTEKILSLHWAEKARTLFEKTDDTQERS